MIPEGKPDDATHQNERNFISFLEYLVRFELGGHGKKLFLIVVNCLHYYNLRVQKKLPI